MTKIAVKKVTGQSGAAGLIASDTDAAAALGKLQDGAELIIEYKRNRSVRQHKLFWALMKTVYANLPEGMDAQFDDLHDFAKCIVGAAGFVKTYQLKSGPQKFVKSIAFENMQQEEFNEVFNACVDFICAEVIPGLGKNELRTEVYNMVGG